MFRRPISRITQPAIHVPVVETERLIMRGHRQDDFAACAAMWADPNVTRYIGGQPLTAEESWAKLLRYVGHWALLGFGYWLVEEKGTGRFVGEVGFSDYKREIVPSMDGVPELGWVLASTAHGRGYATEAVRAALGWGDVHIGPVPKFCLIAPENLASLRVAEKCGFQEVGRTTYKGQPTILFTRE